MRAAGRKAAAVVDERSIQAKGGENGAETVREGAIGSHDSSSYSRARTRA